MDVWSTQAVSACGGKVVSGGKEAKDSVRVWDVAR